MIWIMHEDFVTADTVGVSPFSFELSEVSVLGNFEGRTQFFFWKLIKIVILGNLEGWAPFLWNIYKIVPSFLLDPFSKKLQKWPYWTISRTGHPSSEHLQKCSYLAISRAKSLILWTSRDKILEFFSRIFSSITVSTHALYMTVVSYRTVRCSINLGPCYIGIVNLQ